MTRSISAKAVCEALGLDAEQVARIALHIDAEDFPVARITQYVDYHGVDGVLLRLAATGSHRSSPSPRRWPSEDHHRLDTAAELRLLSMPSRPPGPPGPSTCWPSSPTPPWPAGGGGRGPTGGGTGSRVERVALDGGSRPVSRAVEILAELEGLADRARRVRLGLGECKADRPIEAYRWPPRRSALHPVPGDGGWGAVRHRLHHRTAVRQPCRQVLEVR